jgi:hypothetical protein
MESDFMRHTVIMATTALLLLPRTSTAQDTPRFGLVMGYPANVAVLIKVSDAVSVRPEINWSRSVFESSTTITVIPFVPGVTPIPVSTTTTSTSDGWQVGVGLSGLLYLSKGDALRTYVSPRVSYSRSSSTIDVGIVAALSPVDTRPTTTVTSNYGASGSFGAQYAIGKRFGLFGELGLTYGHSGGRSPSPISSFSQSDQNSWSLGLRSGVGVILYLGS